MWSGRSYLLKNSFHYPVTKVKMNRQTDHDKWFFFGSEKKQRATSLLGMSKALVELAVTSNGCT